MANKKSSKKRILTNKIKNRRNVSKKSKFKTYVKLVKYYISINNKDKSIFFYKKLQSILDNLVLKRVIHKNKSSRCKSKLINFINKMI